jgi:hypothetical protein
VSTVPLAAHSRGAPTPPLLQQHLSDGTDGPLLREVNDELDRWVVVVCEVQPWKINLLSTLGKSVLRCESAARQLASQC